MVYSSLVSVFMRPMSDVNDAEMSPPGGRINKTIYHQLRNIHYNTVLRNFITSQKQSTVRATLHHFTLHAFLL